MYQIGTAAELFWFADKVNKEYGTYGNANAVLTADITVNQKVLKDNGTLADDVSTFTDWTPIGSSEKQYAGTFDGQGHIISGLYFNAADTSYVGLFGYVGSDGRVSDVGVVDSYFSGYDNVGGVCGFNSGTIKNSYNKGSVSGQADVGGVCGGSNGTIKNSYNTGTVNGQDYVGGVCGGIIGTITNCYNTGAVSGQSCVGGVFGYYYFGTITNSYYLAKRESLAGKTASQFKSGAVAYLLPQGSENSGETDEGSRWGQTIGTDDHPVLGGKKVYATTGCVTYNNDGDTGKKEHHYENGKCTDCGRYTEPEKDTDGVYQISNATELYWLADTVNCGNGSIDAVLTKDITVNSNLLGSLEYDEDGNVTNGDSFTDWTPIGYYKNESDESYYTGTFDGQGHTISSLYFNAADTSYVGLFGYVESGGSVSNVGVVDSYFSGKHYVGGVCGWNCGTVENCYHMGTIRGNNDVGGVCGWNGGTVTNCYYLEESETDTIDGTTYQIADAFKDGTVCGLVKYHSYQNGICILCGKCDQAVKNDKTDTYEISNAGQLYWFAGLVNGDARVCIGSVIQKNSAQAVLTADITVNKAVLKEDGTLVEDTSGFKSWTPIGSNSNQYTGTFDGQGYTISGLYFNHANTDYVGLFGYVGENGTVSNVGVVDSYFRGNNYVGGVSGYNSTSASIENSYHAGTVNGSGSYVGGVSGYNSAKASIKNSYHTGAVSGNDEKVGGVSGANEGTITNCYYDNETCKVKGINSSDLEGEAKGKKTEKFAGGEVAYLLNGGTSTGTEESPLVWYQNLDGEHHMQGN